MGLKRKVVRIRRIEHLDDFESFDGFDGCFESPSFQTNPRFHNMIW